jgi:putative copper resistance protein D
LADPLLYVRAIHFAATMLVAGVVLFAIFVAAPAWRGSGDSAAASNVRARLAVIAWIGLALALISGAAWLVLTAAAMSDQRAAQIFSDGVLWTVLSQTTFGRAWLVRLVLACALAAALPPLLSPRDHRSSWLEITAAILAAAFAGALAWSGHAAGGLGSETVIHPAADVLHLIAAAAWVGALLPLIVLFAAAADADDASLAMARTATTRFSILGIVSVGTLLVTGIVNTYYLAGSRPALLHTEYGRLLLIKIALFLAMVAIAAVNRFRLTPQLLQQVSIAASRDALRQLRRNAAIEVLAGAIVIAIVAALGTMPPAIHAAHQHPTYGAVPADAAFVHIHLVEGMADVTIRPGRAGRARATIRLWNEDFEALNARQMSLTLTAPAAAAGNAYPAREGRDGAWQVDGIELSEPGNWIVTVEVMLDQTKRLTLTAPIVIEPGQ